MSELVEKTEKSLKNIKNDLEKKVQLLNEKYNELVKPGNKQTLADKKQIKKLGKEIIDIDAAIKKIDNDLDYIDDKTISIEELKTELIVMADGKRKRNKEEELETTKKELESFCKNNNINNYTSLLEENTAENKKSKFSKNHLLISTIAVIAAISVFGAGYGLGNKNTKGNNNIDSSVSDSNDDNKEQEDKNEDNNIDMPQEEVALFTDINDEEQLYTRAEIINKCYNDFAPELGMTIESSTEMFNAINGGIVNEASEEGALNIVRLHMELMNTESLYATDLKQKGQSNREKSTATIDYGMFFLDGTRAQQLATEISKLRAGIIKAPNSKEAEIYAKEFTELLMNSWYNQGYNCINAYSMETAGSAIIIDNLFLNTAMLVQANIDEGYNITVTNPLTGNEITLIHIIEEINKSTCQTEDGSYINKASQDINAMISEMISNKVNYAQFDYSYTYTID